LLAKGAVTRKRVLFASKLAPTDALKGLVQVIDDPHRAPGWLRPFQLTGAKIRYDM